MKVAGRRMLTTAGVALTAALLTWGFWPSPVEVDVVRPSRGRLTVTVEEDGRTRVRERYIVASPLNGRLLRIGLHSGDAVVSGKTPLAVIEASDPELLGDRARAEAEARVNGATAHRDQAATQIDRATAAEEIARHELERGERLLPKGAITAETIDALRLKRQLAAHDLRAATFGVRIAEFELEQARAALLRFSARNTDQQELFRHEILSPIDGRVLRVFQESATSVTPGTRLVEVGDPADLEVEVDVLSTDAVRIRPGAAVWLHHWGGDEPLEARVRLVEPSAFTKVSALGIEEQRVWVIADLIAPPDHRRTLGDGFRIEAHIVTRDEPDVLKIPAGALFRSGDQWAVYRVVDGRARLQTVQTGATNGLETRILDGLKEDEPIVHHPSDRVRPGARVVERR